MHVVIMERYFENLLIILFVVVSSIILQCYHRGNSSILYRYSKIFFLRRTVSPVATIRVTGF